MKKLAVLILTSIMTFSLAACGQSGAAGTSTGESADPVESTDPAESTASEEETESVESGEITDNSGTAQSEDVPLDGGWSRAGSPAVTDEIKGLVEKATGGIVGASYTPAAYIGSQVVAGRNHKILCRITPIVPDAKSRYSIITLYENLEGNVEITEILDSEAEAEVPEDQSCPVGGWTAAETPDMTGEARAALEKATQGLDGAVYDPIALLATQLVSGTNYSILCEVTGTSKEPETEYVLVHVYEDLEGKAEITDSFSFILSE